MKTMTSTSPQMVAEKKGLTAWAGVQTFMALTALMLAVALAGAALIVASVAVPLGLLVQAISVETTPQTTRRGWQPVTA